MAWDSSWTWTRSSKTSWVTGCARIIEPAGYRIGLQNSFLLDDAARLSIRPDVLIRHGAGSVVAVADIKYKEPETTAIGTSDVYQAVVYAKRFDLDTVHLVYAGPPPYDRLRIGDVEVRLASVDLEAADRGIADLAATILAAIDLWRSP